MAYGESLLRRVREVSETGAEWVEKKMFGGLNGPGHRLRINIASQIGVASMP